MELEHISHNLALDLAYKSSNTQKGKRKQAQETGMHAYRAPSFLNICMAWPYTFCVKKTLQEAITPNTQLNKQRHV